MLDLHIITGTLAVLMIALSLRGFASLLNLRGKAPSDYLIRAAALWGGSYALRTAWWDQLRLFIGDEAFLALSATVGGVEINTLFNVLVIVGGYQFCRFLHEMIPAERRAKYHWFSAPFYPARWFIRRDNPPKK